MAVSTYSAAMATSSMAIDSAAKWVRVCEYDNLVKITFKADILHTASAPPPSEPHPLARAISVNLFLFNFYERSDEALVRHSPDDQKLQEMYDAITKALFFS